MPYLGRQPGVGVRNRYIYTATASQDTFSGADDNGATLAYDDAAYVDVYLNGVLLIPVTDYAATTKTSIVLTSAAAADDLVEILAYEIASIADTVSKANGGTFAGPITVEGAVTVNGNVSADGGTIGSIEGTADGTFRVKTNANNHGVTIEEPSGGAESYSLGTNSDGDLGFYNSGSTTAAVTINDSGQLLVAATELPLMGTDNTTGVGIEVGGTGRFVTDGDTAIFAKRQTSDGDLIGFYQGTSNVGAIGSVSGSGLYIQSQQNTTSGPLIQIRDSGGSGVLTLGVTGGAYGYIGDTSGSQVGVGFVSTSLRPVTSSDGAGSDNTFDLGSGSYRWDDIYATSGTVNPSDSTLKQQIASLTDTEINAAKAISKLFKTFKWNDRVETKGDAARTHTGVIAQEIEQAMIDAGLDVGNYGFFIRSIWWETDETYTDNDGVEQTITNTYDTLEEAPEGAVERTRLGIRYHELLAFIGAATEQRLTSIEARLATLENT